MSEPVAVEDTLEYFLSICHDFHLGTLLTESPNPVTENLSTLCKDPSTVPQALNTLQEVDVNALCILRTCCEKIEVLAHDVHETFIAGKKIVLEGCGATGRLSLSTEAFARSGLVEEAYRDKVLGFMAGGDAALIRSIEKFEDRNAFGERQLHDIGFEEGDLLMAITEGGETPFVIAACNEALKVSKNDPYFIYCNPDDILMGLVERSRQVIANPRIKKINLCTGPMAITGSTRMQATTVQLACVGLAIQHHAHPDRIAASLDALVEVVTAIQYGTLAPFTISEAKLYRDREYFLYESVRRDFATTMITDTTERSPTFSLPAFENFNLKNSPNSQVYLHIPGTKTVEESWCALLYRPARPLEWEETKNSTGVAALSGFDFSDQLVGKREERIGVEKTQCRVRVNDTPDGILFSIRNTQNPASAVATEVELKLPVAFVRNDLLLANVLLKCLLNAHSTIIMGILGRYEGNVMTYVRPSNYKLIDRAARYILLLLKKVPGMDPLPSYEEVVRRLFERRATLQPEDPIVLVVVDSFCTERGLSRK